jgi:hypothetical protein
VLLDEVSKSVVFVIADVENEAGDLERKPIGTGFFVSTEDGNGTGYTYVVSAAHVVMPSVNTWIRMRDALNGRVLTIPIFGWLPHESEDVAVAFIPLGPAGTPAHYAFRRHDAVALEEPEFRLGADVFFAGLLAGVSEMEQTCIPMVRSGTVAAIGQAGIPLLDGRHVTGHLIDCRSFAGFSGSPCLLHWDVWSTQPTRQGLGTSRTMNARLMGILLAHFDEIERERRQLEAKDSVFRINIGVGIVLPVERIWEVIDSEEVIEQRRSLLGPS